MPVTINGTTGITDADGGTVLSSADIASQAQAEAGTNNTVLMTPARAAQAIAALSGFQNMTIGATSSSFTVPSNVTRLFVMAFGGGGGGGGSQAASFSGGEGGSGGVAASILAVNPGDVFSYTVGLGGAGTNTNGAAGTSGGTTSVGSISCTGGAGGGAGSGVANGTTGANGTGSGGNVTSQIVVFQTYTFLAQLPISGVSALNSVWTINTQVQTRPRAVSSTSAVVYSISGSFLPGSNGRGELSTSSVDASGGVGGAVIFMY